MNLRKMKEITHQNLDAFCCTCLVDLIEDPSLTHGKYSIQEKSLEELVHFCASIPSMPIMEDIQLPKFVCGICFEKLQSFQEFCYQTVEIFSILSNISKKFNESKTTHDQITDSGQYEQAKLDVSEIKVKEEFTEDSTVHSNSTNSQEILHNSREFAIESEINIETCEEFEQVTPISDIKIEPSECVDMFYLCRARDTQNDEDFPTNISSNSTPPPAIHDSGHHIVDEQSTVVCPDLLSNNESETAANSNLTYLRKPYSCSVCKRSFSYLKNFQTHVVRHKRTNRHDCEECGNSFITFGQFHTHLQKVHGVILPGYKCPYNRCGKMFNSLDSYEKHQRTQHTRRTPLWDTFELKQPT